MPIKTKSGKWKWGNIERDSKKELVQTVYGIWKKNGSKGSFSDFLKGTHESVLNEAKADLKDKLYFHGSAFKSLYEDKTIKPPSYSRPFFITSDIHYAIAFSGHRYGGSGRVKGRGKFVDVKKERYVYVVSLNKDAEFLDFRTNEGYNEFISFFPDGLKEILKTLPRNLQYFNVGGDPFKIGVAIQELLENLYDLKIERKVANPAADDVWEHAWIRLDENAIIDKLYKELFETENILSELIKQSNSLQKIRNIGPHDLLAYVYKELDKKGYSGIIGIEEDTNEQRKAKVETENSIGIWNVNGLDKLTTTALPVSKLYDINKYIDIDIHSGDTKKEINQRIVDLVNAIEKESTVKESTEESYFVTDLDYNKHIKPILDVFKSWPHVNVGNITKHDKDVKLKWFGLYTGHKLEDIVALVAIQTNFDDYTINIANVCSNGHGNGKKLLDKIIDYYSKTDRKYLVWFADPNGGEKLKNYYRTNFPDAEETEEKNEWWQTSKFTLKLKESVEPKDKFFKIKKNGKEIGKYGLSFYDDIKAVGIGDLEVYPEFRNKGYGTKIIKDIVDKYKNDYDKIYCFVDKDNKDAIRLYKRLGKVSDEITYSQKIGDYEYKNTNGQHYVEFYNKLKESMNTEDIKIYAYHCTEVDPEKIKKEGWKAGKGYTLDNHYEELYKKYLPKVPVFISDVNAKVWDNNAKYCIKLDITGLDLYPDFGHLEDFDAYYDEDNESFYWENEDDLDSNKKLKDFVLDNCDNLTLYADCFDGDDSFNVLGTACIDGSKLKDRIVEWKSSIKESYEPPYTLDTIKQKYGDEVYRKLRDDPVHRFRAETGIEVIHKEPTRDEFERIVKNWDLMTPEQKKQSDEFSMKQFGRDNKDRIELLRKEYDFKVGDRVTIRKGLRCRQSGHSGKIIRVNLPEDHDYDSHGFSSFTIEMDDPNLGITSFQSGAIEKEMKKESALLEDKTSMIKKLVLPDISSDEEKNSKKEYLIKWFEEHPNYENKVDWNKWKTLTSEYFDDLINNYKKSNREKKEEVREPSGKDPKSFFENVEKRKFKIVDENDDWLFVAPLNHEAAMFCDDKECGGGSAEWCIGMKGRVSYWNKYISDGSKFIMAFSKHFDTMPIKELFTNLKFMFQENSNKEYLIWDQTDVSDGIEIAKTKFGKNFDDFRKLFSKVDLHEYETSMWHWSERTAESAVIDSITLPDAHILKLSIPKETTKIDDEACQLGETSEYTEIDELVLNKKLKSIGYLSFVEINIKNLSYDDGCELSYIGHYAFSGCDFNDTIDLSGLDNLTEIGDYAFQNNRYVKSIKLPPNITKIGDKVFDGCKNLLHLEIPSRFFDPESDYYKLSKICGNINYDDIDIVPIDENGKPIEHDEN